MKRRILIIDDSLFMRTMLKLALQKLPEFDVVGEAPDGQVGLEMIQQLRPDVVTLDIEMPGLTGLQVLERIMSSHPLPVVVVSTKTQVGAATTLEAMERGAVTCVAKPIGTAGSSLEEFQHEVVLAIRTALSANSEALGQTGPIQPLPLFPVDRSIIVAIGISAGGPPTLQKMLPALPIDFPAIVLTQHMPPDFVPPFAKRLDERCQMEVKVAGDRDELLPGRVLIAPGSHHLLVRRSSGNFRVKLDDGPKVSGFRPSVDAMFGSLAETAGPNVVSIVMTGMGSDGAIGTIRLKEAGATVMAQDEASSVVYGMPKAAFNTKALDHVVGLSMIPAALLSACQAKSRTAQV